MRTSTYTPTLLCSVDRQHLHCMGPHTDAHMTTWGHTKMHTHNMHFNLGYGAVSVDLNLNKKSFMMSCEPKRASAYSNNLRWHMVYMVEMQHKPYREIAESLAVDCIEQSISSVSLGMLTKESTLQTKTLLC